MSAPDLTSRRLLRPVGASAGALVSGYFFWGCVGAISSDGVPAARR